jgi:hypothetical protein
MDERIEEVAREIDMQPEPQPVPAAADIQTVIAQLQGMQQSQLEQANRLDALQRGCTTSCSSCTRGITTSSS